MTQIVSEDVLLGIARALGQTEMGLTNPEIDDLLQQCRVPDEMGPGTKWRRIHVNLWNHQCRTKNRTHVLAFIRKAMKPARYLHKNRERFEAIRTDLNEALAFAGLVVNQAGKLKTSDSVSTIGEAERRAQQLCEGLELRGIHPDVLAFCKAELLQDNYFHAVLEATKSVFEKVRHLSGRTEDGASLIDKAFLGDTPILAINDLATESQQSEQKGLANLLKGLYGMFRNPTAHAARVMWQMNEEDARDLLSIVSLVHRRLDDARRVGGS